MAFMRRGRAASRLLGIVSATLTLTLTAAGAASADVSDVGGGAYGASVNVTTLGLLHVQVGPTPQVTLPTAGSSTPISTETASLNSPGLLSLGLLDMKTQGTPSGGSVDSSASVAQVLVPLVLSADLIQSSCHADASGATGTTNLTNLVVAGVKVDANVAPNTVIGIPGIATVTLNEQIQTGSATAPGITVNAIDIKLLAGLAGLGTGDIVIGDADCSVVDPVSALPIGTIGGITLTGALGVLFTVRQLRRRPGAVESV